MRLLLLGDIHGFMPALYDATYLAKSVGLQGVIQCGDFGFSKYTRNLIPGPFEVPVYAIDGNHEDHHFIRYAYPRHFMESNNLFLMKRGSVKTFGKSTIGFIGGTYNVDRPNNGNVSKGTVPFITDRDRELSIHAFNALNPDMIIAHNCPCEIGVGIHGSMDFVRSIAMYVTSIGGYLGDINDCGDGDLTAIWKNLNSKPMFWVFGHYHKYHQAKVGTTDFLCVGCGDQSDYQPFPQKKWFVYDTDNKIIEVYKDIVDIRNKLLTV